MNRKWLVIGIIMLFIGSCVSASTAPDAEKTQSTTRGDWLYVGGGGPGNYTRIQDAVDDATDGDIVYVFDDSSPYMENIVINRSISLRGEDKNTTIIDGANESHGVNITADNVMVMGFTIQYCNGSGVCLRSNGNTITDTILTSNYYGVSFDLKNPPSNLSEENGHNTISNNRITNVGCGIFFVGEGNNTITGNIISLTESAIMLMAVQNTNISFNTISENEIGAWIWMSYNTMIYRNNFSNNSNFGLSTLFTSADKILQNNFIGNNRSALSCQSLLYEIHLLKKGFHFPIRRNVWKENYWDEPRQLPYKIPGLMNIKFWVDWHPAQAPYDI